MKKAVVFLSVLVVILSGWLIYSYLPDSQEDMKVQNEGKNPFETKGDKTYRFKDIESMEKATSVKSAFDAIFGENRVFNNFKDEDYNKDEYIGTNFHNWNDGEMKYYLNGGFSAEDVSGDINKYNPEMKYSFEKVFIGISERIGFDTRMEMIDFLHYLQYSGLTKPHYIQDALPEDSVAIYQLMGVTLLEDIPPFEISMKVYSEIKPGMNMPESHQGWSINSETVEIMDFSNKEELQNSIGMYGEFEGINPSRTPMDGN